MESARRFTSKSSRSVSVSAAIANRDNTREGRLDSFSDLLKSEPDEEKVEEKTPVAKTNVRDIWNRFDHDEFNEMKSLQEIKMKCMQYLLFWLFGGKWEDCMDEECMSFPGTSGGGMMTIESTYEESYSEYEETSFSTVGTVKTADGREINFNLSLQMSRSFEQYYMTKDVIQMQSMIDPLVINLDSNIATLSDQKFRFDLDADGTEEEISFLNGPSGFLALDKNGDGRINDGSELFGTKSGDGFYDLAAYDEDHNGWIDENDDIFSKLRIWTKDVDGNDELYYLKDAGVGAICLAKASTQFSHNSLADNHTNGMLRSSGIFLYENGNVGTIQQIDLAG